MVEKKKYKGFFEDWFEVCEAENEKEALQILKKRLIEEINETEEPLIVWEET